MTGEGAGMETEADAGMAQLKAMLDAETARLDARDAETARREAYFQESLAAMRREGDEAHIAAALQAAEGEAAGWPAVWDYRSVLTRHGIEVDEHGRRVDPA